MRKIKFRAWDKKNQKMLYGKEGFVFEGDGCVLINIIQSSINGDEEPIIMQYTGVKDSEGAEIYEGDIVKNKKTSYKDISIVVWDKEKLQFKLKSIKQLPQTSMRNFEYGKMSAITYNELKVIGNKYENTELLK